MVFDGSVYFIGMQEDGLLLLPGQGGNPSAYLRADVNLSKIEAVRGGSASILGVNAPGGIFNYISKTGGKQFEGIVSTRLGLEGNGKNPYYRLEGNFGGPLSKDKSWTYNIGGHFRYANGAKYPGYPLSHGGQIKGNILKTFATGSLRLNVKWLNDRTKDFEFTPTVDFDKPRPAGHFTNSSSVLIDPVHLTIPSTGDGVRSINYNSKDLNHLKDNSISLHWEQRLNDNWKMTQAFKLSQKSSVDVGTFIVYPNDVTSFLFNAIFDMAGKEGKYKFYNAATKQVYGILTQDFSQPTPFTFSGNLPGSDIISNGVFFTPMIIVEDKRNDFFYQGIISKTWTNMKFTTGIYSNKSTYKYYNGSGNAGTGFSTIEDRPQLIAIEYAPADGGPVQQFTDAKGVSGYQRGINYASYNKVKTWDNAIYFGHQWDITPRLNLDWGGRYEWLDIINSYRVQNENTYSTTGGVDKNPLTLYDNYDGSLKPPVTYTKQTSTYSFSAGLNYKQNDHLAYYIRFSSGNKVADISTYIGGQTAGESSNILPQKTIQLEGGIKYLTAKTNITVTPFLSILSSLPTLNFDTDTLGNLYNLPILYNKVHATGIDLETNIQLGEGWNIRANGVIQQFFTDKYQQWYTGNPGAQDDSIIDQSGKKISFFAAPYIFNIAPSYNYKKLYVGLNWYSISKRAANANEAFYLPGYSQFDLNLGYALSKKVNIKFSINNLINHFGIVDWSAPITDGIFFTAFNNALLTRETIKANPNAIYYTMGIQPRSFFLDLTIKF